MKSIFFGAMALLSPICYSLNAQADGPTRPNIVFILADDQSWNGTSVQMHPDLPESKSDYYRTPNLERLAKTGLTFSQAYAPGPMCLPTRASLQTGKSPAQLKLTNVGSRRSAPWQQLVSPELTGELADEEITIAEMLNASGYATASFGKWHLQGADGPGSHGYDEHDGPTANADGNPDNQANPKDIFGITDRGMAFMKKHSEARRPFFLQLWHYAVHGPVQARVTTEAAIAARRAGQTHQSAAFAAMTEDLDTSVGMILRKLEELSIADTTFVVYMSDHGASRRLSSNAPLSGGKGTLWEGGLRVPLIIRGPGVLEGKYCRIPVVGWDLFPTFREICGVQQPVPTGVEGVSLQPLFGSSTSSIKRDQELAFHFPHYREGPNGSDEPPHATIVVDNYKLMKTYGSDQLRLFDLSTDISERNDLAQQMPERVAMMHQRLNDYLEQVQADLPSPNPNFDPSATEPSNAQPPRSGRRRLELVERFDSDDNGRLNRSEREKARRFIRDNSLERRPEGSRRGPETGPGAKVTPADVTNYPDSQLYDESILRTFFIDFKHDDWERELADFYRSDVEVPATVRVDGKTYKQVGIKFRGNSSFFTVYDGQKRSLNLTFDFVDEKQELYGYRTINLLNAHQDPSLLREVLYNHIARNYVPAPKANFVKVVINGENWGIYVNAQQFNRDFIQEWFGEQRGARWKVPAGAGTDRSLNYSGNHPEAYGSYELKSRESEQARRDLINLCKLLNETPIEELDTKLDAFINLDRVLWFLALDNTLIDQDGYYARGNDYLMYQDERHARFHILPYDSNEVFRVPGTNRRRRRPRRRPGGVGNRPARAGLRDQSNESQRNLPRRANQSRPSAGLPTPIGFALSPFAGEAREDLPLVSRLLANSRIRARYVAHVRTITNQWLDWQTIGPIINGYRELIDAEVKLDTRKLMTYQDFAASVDHYQETERRPAPGLRLFVEGRREYLLNNSTLNQPAPQILSVTHQQVGQPRGSTIRPGEVVRVQARISEDVPVSEVLLYFAAAAETPFESITMLDDRQKGDGVFEAVIPSHAAGSHVHYYIEARSAEMGTTAFEPEACELHAHQYRVVAEIADASDIVINEILAANTTIKDPQGDFDDWIELHNVSDKPVDLTGMYLSDRRDNPRKWTFPTGTMIGPRGYLIIWADQDVEAKDGLHANFKLSSSGETVLLVDRDDRNNVILEMIEFDRQTPDISVGKHPEDRESLRQMKPSPGTENRVEP